MRIRFVLGGIAVIAVAASMAIQACGGTATDDTPVDAGRDVVEAALKDTFVPDVKDSAPTCDPKADFLKDIPDASVADGATTSGICLGCAKSKCQPELAACSKDCACQSLAGDAVACYLSGAGIFKCAGKFVTVPAATRNIGLAVFGCLNQECATECAVSSFVPDGGDGGDAADGG